MKLSDYESTDVKAVIISIVETNYWNEDIQKQAKEPILGIYIVDLTRPTNCAEITVSYFAHWLKNHFTNVSNWQDEKGEWLDCADELFDSELDGGEGIYLTRYSNVEVIKEIKYTDEEFGKLLLSFDEDDAEQAHSDWINSMLEYYNANTPI